MKFQDMQLKHIDLDNKQTDIKKRLVWLFLCYINHCRLFNVKPCLYICIVY